MMALEPPLKSLINDAGMGLCADCGEYNVETMEIPFGKDTKRIPKDRICNNCREVREAEQKEKEERRKKASAEYRLKNIEELLSRCGVPKRYRDCAMENYQGKLPINRPVFICGPPGTGKTHLAVAYLREEILLSDWITQAAYGEEEFKFLRAVDLFKEIRASFGDKGEGTEDHILKQYGSATFLVLDDLGAEKITDFVRQTLYDLLDKRYGDMRETVITSNLSLQQFADEYGSHGDRLASRIAGMGDVFTLTGKDKRLKGSK